jgi:hypothetical protein
MGQGMDDLVMEYVQVANLCKKKYAIRTYDARCFDVPGVEEVPLTVIQAVNPNAETPKELLDSLTESERTKVLDAGYKIMKDALSLLDLKVMGNDFYSVANELRENKSPQANHILYLVNDLLDFLDFADYWYEQPHETITWDFLPKED